MKTLDPEIAAYEAVHQQLEAEHTGKWVVFHDAQIAGVFESFDAAAADAVKRFGRGPYLIRQIGAPPITLPASLLYRPVHGSS